ncbi:MAG: lactate utilization protein [Syntrophales bacterium]|jgi:L-lactate dehydrogenase complex protein LldG|nr:lactate utilization protein [Syntrophales bacterium]
MKKTNGEWKRHLPAGGFGAHLFPEFEKRAKAAATEVFRVKTHLEATQLVLTLARQAGARKVVATESPLLDEAGLKDAFTAAGIEFYDVQDDIAANAPTADIGISGVEFGIAESGSVCQDAYSIESRLVSTLPPLHIALLDSNLIVPGISEAFAILAKAFERGYVTFITGPSRTADIEVVLTIGVHGPVRLVIIALDEIQAEGSAQ